MPLSNLDEDWIAMAWDAYYNEVRSTYDRLAEDYDATVGRALVSRRAKELAVNVVAEFSPLNGALLDVGCYTGTESLLLARRGYRVVGIDLSPRMIDLARAKARRWGVQDSSTFLVARASELSVVRQMGLGPFDTAYSVYGTLNLEPRIDAFKASLVPNLKAGGTLIVGLLNPIVLYELIFGPLFLQFQGYRKLGKARITTRVGSGKDALSAFLYTPREFARLVEPEFELRRIVGVHFLYPPPSSGGGPSEGFWRAARALDALERRLETSRTFSALGLFALLVFRKS